MTPPRTRAAMVSVPLKFRFMMAPVAMVTVESFERQALLMLNVPVLTVVFPV